MTALTTAIANGRWRQAQLLIEAGYNVNCRGTNRRTPLIELCFIDNEDKAVDLARKLIERGAQVELTDSKGITPLSYACLLGKRKLVFLFTEFVDYDLNAADSDFNTALFHAVTNGDKTIVKEIVKKLKQYGLSVDKENCHGETPLIQAIKLGHLACADILIKEGKASLRVYDREHKKRAKEWHKEIQRKQPFIAHDIKESQQIKNVNGMHKKPRKVVSFLDQTNSLSFGCQPVEKVTPLNDAANLTSFTLPSEQSSSVSENLPNLYKIYNQQNSSSFREGYKFVPKQTNPLNNETSLEYAENETGTSNDSNGKNSPGKHRTTFLKINELNLRLKDLNAIALRNRKLTNSFVVQECSLPDLFSKRTEDRPRSPSNTSRGGTRTWPKVHRTLKSSTLNKVASKASLVEETLL